MNRLLPNLRQALRALWFKPGFTVTVILTLAIGLGANIAMFSLVYGILLAPLPLSHPERTVVLEEHSPAVDMSLVSPITYADWLLRSPLFTDLAAFRFWENRSIELASSEALPVLQVSATPNYFHALGWSPEMGRTYSDEKSGGTNEAVVSHNLWIRIFHGDRAALGKTIRISGTAFILVGVMPPMHNDLNLGFADVWTPLHRYNLEQQRLVSYRSRYLRVVGRLKPEISIAQAQTQMNVLQQQLAQEATSVAKGFQARVVSLQDAAGARVRPVLLALFAAVGFVLLIACVNVANLMLTRAATRSREYAIRLALGANKWQLARHLLTETMLLASFGGLVGMAFGWGALQLLKLRLAESIPRMSAVQLSWPVFLFAGVLVIVIGFLFSASPLLGFGVSGIYETLKESGRSGSGGVKTSRLRSALIAAEVAFSVVLLIFAGLFLKSFANLLHSDPGFATDRRVVMDLVLPAQQYATENQRTAYYRDLFRKLEAEPGIRAVGAALYFPCRPKIWPSTIWVEGSTVAEGLEPIVYFNLVAGNYFRAMAIPLRRGRLPSIEEMWSNRHVAVINQAMAHRIFPGVDALGKRFKTDKDGTWNRIIGVVGDVRQRSLDETPQTEFYVPYSSMPMPFLTLAADSSTPAAQSIQKISAIAEQGASGLKIQNAATLGSLVSSTVVTRRMAFVLIVIFAILSLSLAAIGIYGVVSYSVAQRKAELGIRMALGATQSNIRNLVIRQGIRTSLAGVLGGVIASLAIGPASRSLLYGVAPIDPLVMSVASLFGLAVTAAACAVPALRAGRVNPMQALRQE